MDKIEELEHRYQLLLSDFQAGRIDEAMFTSKVDQLQFQDTWGRYWMIGAQTGAWHYYDGQTWHQAEPRDADKLPFMDEQGRYWQRGIKSGDWYYYQPETGEWVKPGPGDTSPLPVSQPRDIPKYRSTDQSAAPYLSHLQQARSTEAGPTMPAQFEGELFQDDEGRYWTIGSKTGQWYFFDHEGWHPAHEFQNRVPAAQPQAPAYSSQTYPPSSYYPYQPGAGYPPTDPQAAQQVYYQPQGPQPGQVYGSQPPIYSQPAQNYTVEPSSIPPAPSIVSPQGEAPVAGQPQVVAPGEAKAAPVPPGGDSGPGSWFYFDGKQWLKYASGEPADAPPVDPKKVVEQEAQPAQAKAEPKSEAVVAEFFEAEPPVEVVDVEVITVVEAEPEDEPEPIEKQVEKKVAPPPSQPMPVISDDIRPRRARRNSDVTPARPAPVDPAPQPRERGAADPSRPVMPRKKETAHEPTIIIPTGAVASRITSPAPAPAARTASRPVKAVPAEGHRARENTVPMEPVSTRTGTTLPAPAGQSHGEITQAMPVASRAARADTGQMKVARQVTQPNPVAPATAAPAANPPAETQPQKKGYTVGDVLRSLPSTFWTAVGGITILLIFFFVIVAAMALLNRQEGSVGGLAVMQSPTPTLASGPPDTTPTPGPTPETSPEAPAAAAAVPETVTFGSPELGITLEYPETWYREEDENMAIFSPSEAGLDPATVKDVAFWVSADDNSTLSELLTGLLANFPADAENLNEGTISIASQTWTSVQIRFEDENIEGQGIATLAVTSKDGRGYTLVAVAPAEKWNASQPIFQTIINSFRFSANAVAEAEPSTREPTTAAGTKTAAPEASGTKTRATATPGSAKPTPTPTPATTATPLMYVIQPGDTLLAISLKFGVDVDELAQKNDIDDPAKLSLGQELIIPFTAEELAAYNGDSPASGSSAAADKEPTRSSTSAPAEEASPAEASDTPAESPAVAAEPTPAASTAAAPVSGKIIYPAFNPGPLVYDLWLLDVASGEQNAIVGEASQPAFNRDGSLLAYRSWGLSTRGIFFRDFIGGRGGQVTKFVEDGLPTWSPDGFTFTFASRREGDRVPRLYVGNQQGVNDYSIGFQGEYLSVFPDGQLIAKGCLPSGDCGLFLLGANGGGEKKISGEVGDTAPAVSPNGSKIAFMSSGRGGSSWEIWLMNPDGSNPQRLTDNHNNDGLPAWSPDGKSIAWVSDQGGGWAIWVMNTDGSNQRRLANMMGSPDGSVLRDKDNSKGWLEERISWAP